VRRILGLLATAALTAAVLPVTSAAAAPPSRTACDGRDRIEVPGAELQRVSPCLSDLTTAGLLAGGFNGVYTDAADFAGLHAPGTVNPRGVPGVQVDGYFPDTSTTNALHGWNHDAQFVIRLPERWNGRIVVAGAPGVRKQYSSDFMVSDRVLAKGYAYASIDKGNTGLFFFRDGTQPGDAIREWHERTTQVARAAQAVVRQTYGRPAAKTYMTGISNGGYLTRWQLENRPGVFDGGVESEGTLFEADNNLLGLLPTALRAYPVFRDSTDPAAKEAARQAMYAAGFEPGSELLWDLHYRIYWDLTQRIYREELDPSYDGALEAGITPDCPIFGKPGCSADTAYDVSTRPDVAEALRGLTLTGKLKRPMLSLHGDLDTLLPISLHGTRYAELVDEQRRSRLHRLYVVERGQHVDSFVSLFPEGALRAMLPCYTDAFDALVAWVERDVEPPTSGPVEPAAGAAVDDCTL
jgi:hypothetical protein